MTLSVYGGEQTEQKIEKIQEIFEESQGIEMSKSQVVRSAVTRFLADLEGEE